MERLRSNRDKKDSELGFVGMLNPNLDFRLGFVGMLNPNLDPKLGFDGS